MYVCTPPSNPGTVGISQYAADALGDVVYAQLPEPGEALEAGQVRNTDSTDKSERTTRSW